MNPQITQIAQTERPCGRLACRTIFMAKRSNQKYCCAGCRQKAKDERHPLKRLKPDEHRRIEASRKRRKSGVHRFERPKSVPAAIRERSMPLEAKCEGAGKHGQDAHATFTWQAPPGNIKGLLAQVAIRAPRTMLRLAAAIREDTHGRDAHATRPSCIGCGFRCGDGEICRVLGAGAI